METAQKNSPYLTPTYQNALSKALMDVIMARNTRDIEQYWTNTETLYFICPDNVITEINKKADELIENLNIIQVDGTSQTSAQRSLERQTHKYKKQNADTFFKLIMNSLRAKGYAQIETGASPKFGGIGTL